VTQITLNINQLRVILLGKIHKKLGVAVKVKKIATVISSAAIVASSFVGVTAMATPAFAVGCTGGGCDARDPQQQGCSADAYTAYSTVDGVKKYASFTYGNAKVELRYSPSCYSFWARVTIITAGWPGNWLYGLGYDNGVRVDASWNERIPIHTLQSPGNAAWTAMWGRRSAARYSYGAQIGQEGGSYAEIRWPVTRGVIWS
jgi:hypothetical protein